MTTQHMFSKVHVVRACLALRHSHRHYGWQLLWEAAVLARHTVHILIVLKFN